MSDLPQRRTARLQFGRVSLPGARYFVTCCTKDRAPIFAEASVRSNIKNAFATLQRHDDFELHAATVMPDHVHLLFTLGSRLSFSQVLAKFKSLARENGRARWRWQVNGFEHRLRDNESIEPYGFYLFMNPYVADLCATESRWPGWLCPDPNVFSFLSALGGAAVPLSWRTQVQALSSVISVGE